MPFLHLCPPEISVPVDSGVETSGLECGEPKLELMEFLTGFGFPFLHFLHHSTSCFECWQAVIMNEQVAFLWVV